MAYVFSLEFKSSRMFILLIFLKCEMNMFSSGMIGSIVFAYYQSSSLDAHCKQWRLFADILNDLAMTMAIISPLFSPFTFVMLSCLSSLFHALVGVAGSTTRAALRYELYAISISHIRNDYGNFIGTKLRTCNLLLLLMKT